MQGSGHLKHWFDEYVYTVRRELHVDSQLQSVIPLFTNQTFQRDIFLTVGLEAAGHRLFKTLPLNTTSCAENECRYHSDLCRMKESLCRHQPGDQQSFSANAHERHHRDSNQYSTAQAYVWPWYFPKYLIVLRRALPHFVSFLHRYWNEAIERLDTHYDAWITSATQMQIFVHSLIAAKKPIFVVPYDHFCENTRVYHQPLSFFLSVPANHLTNWFATVRRPIAYNIHQKLRASDWGRWNSSLDKSFRTFEHRFDRALSRTELYTSILYN